MSTQQMLTTENVQTLYPPDRYIVVMPAVSKFLQTSGQGAMYAMDAATVKIDPDDEKAVYPLSWDGYGENARLKTVGLTAKSLNLIGGAADVNVVTEREDDARNPMYARVRAFAVMQTPGGAVRGRTATVEWDGELMRDKIRLNAQQSVKNGVAKNWQGYRGKTEAQLAEMVEDKFQKEWIAEREFGKRKVETKAARNAIKQLVAISDSYGYADLKTKEFVVIKFVFAPDTSDPMVKQMVLEAGLRAQRALFGATAASQAGGAFLPEGSHYALAALPPAPAAAEAAAVEPADEPVEAEWGPPDEAPDDPWTGCEARMPELSAGLEAMKAAGKLLPEKIVNALGTAVGNRDAELFEKVWGWWQKFRV